MLILLSPKKTNLPGIKISFNVPVTKSIRLHRQSMAHRGL